MASNSKRVKGATTNSEACDESSESDGETEPAKSFHRRLSTNKEIKCSAAIKEGFLMKQTWSFQRWRRRYFKLKGRKLYYAKDTKAEIFDEIELTDLSFAECSIKNVNHSFQVITPFRSLVLCAESRREMEDWLSALAAASQGRFHEPDQPDCLYGYHHWYATSHARPTYCNVCREALSGVTSHGLSCEVCKCKVHKRCAAKAINNCKWTTLSSVGKDIIEDSEGNILMPHQWMEGNLPVSAKCMICEKNCGSVLRLQDWRCLWCRGNVHTACRPLLSAACPLGPARVSVVPPTALHCIQDEAWDAVRPQASSPLLVFVNSKSGDNQGVKFLRRFKQLLNPAQVFDLISTGPRLGLRLFRHFDPFRILVCSGDGSVGWVLSEIDKLDMHKQCQIAVLPLGTGNDLARVLGWGSSCDDDTHLPQLLDKYERASTKMLDRWSIMTLERAFGLAAKFSLTPADTSHIDAQLRTLMTECEESVNAHIQKILQSDEVAVVLSSAKFVFESIKELLSHVTESAILKGDEKLISKSDVLQQNLDSLMQTLSQEDALSSELSEALEKIKQDMEPSLSTLSKDKSEKDLSNFKKSERTRRKLVHRESLVICTNNLKKAMRSFVECVEQFLDEQSAEGEVKASRDKDMITLKVLPTIDSASSLGEASLCPSPSPLTSSRQSLLTARLTCISPLPDLRRDSACDDPDNLLTLPVPHEFADSRRSSHARKSSVGLDDDLKNINLVVSSTTLNIEQDNKSYNDQDCSLVVNLSDSSHLQQAVYENIVDKGQQGTDVKQTTEIEDDNDEDKECSSMMSAMSNEEISITSDILDQKSFIPRKDSDGEDINGHIYHIDSPEMSDTYPNSEALQGESLMDDISSLLGQDIFIAMAGLDQDSNDNTYTDDTTLFASDTTDISKELQYRRSLKKKKLEEIEAQYGFENRAFMTQNIFLEKDNRCDDQKLVEPIKYCSLAQFVEGNDIARKSFKRSRQRSTKLRKLETSTKPTTVTEETESLDNIKIEILGSNHSLNEIMTTEFDIKTDETIEIPVVTKPEEMETSTEDTETRTTAFGPVSVVVEPPSPISSEQSRLERSELAMKRGSLTRGEFDYMKKLKDDYLFPNGEDSSHCSSNSNLLGIDSEYMNFLKSSPAASRRISSGSLLKAGEAAALAAVAAKDSENEKKDKKDDTGERNKRLPIINPLVTLPTWPNVSSGAGFISQCLLANADALCAAVSPLMDPDETLLEGFIERCVMNNYFGIGIDAKITLDFHNKREEHPEKCRSRAKNYMWYGVLGSKQWLQRTYRNLEQRVQLECDGQRIPLPSLQGIVILNIPSFMGGTNFWGSTKKDDIFLSPSFDDRILEVVAVFGSVQMAASRLINLQHHRIAQCQTVQINILGEEGVPVQVDGEAWVQPPGVIRIIHKNRMQMLCRNRALETSLRAWEEKLAAAAASGEKSRQPSISHGRQSLALPRQSITGLLGVNIGEKVRQQSFSGQGLTVPTPIEKSHSIQFIERLSAVEPDYLFTEEENALLLSFIECSTTLVKWVKILAISHSNIEVDLYSLASRTDTCLENIHPNGKILEGELLREEFTKLVDSAKNLYIECCCLLRDKGHNLKLREDLENKLSVSLANTEMELRKCVLVETPKGSLVYLQPLHEDQNERKNRKGLFWLKFRGKSLLSHGSSSGSTARDVASWGTSEVATWLETLQLAEYTDSFIRNDIRGRELLTLARRDLKDLGVTKVGHVKRILQAIKDLNQG